MLGEKAWPIGLDGGETRHREAIIIAICGMPRGEI